MKKINLLLISLIASLSKYGFAPRAASVDVVSGYAGDVADVILALTESGNEAVSKGSVYVNPGVEKTLFIPRLIVAQNALQDRQADPTTPSDSFDWRENQITPNDAMFYDLFNPRNFEDVWRPFQPVGPLVDRVNNPRIQAALAKETMLSVGTQVGTLIWQGDVTAGPADPLRFFDGYVTLALASADTIKVPGTGAITAGNVISILEQAEAAIPSTIWGDPNVIFHMSTTDFRLYLEAARALDFKGSNITEAVDEMFAGRRIRFYNGMKKDYILVAKATAGKDSNLWAGVAVDGDTENVKIERHRPESENFFIKVLFKYGVNFGLDAEVVITSPV